MNRLMLLLIFAGALFASASEDLSAADLSEDLSDLSADLFVQTNSSWNGRRRRRFFGGVAAAAKSIAAAVAASAASRASLTEAQKDKAAREIVFDGKNTWNIYDDGKRLMGSISCPCKSLNPRNKASWPDEIAEIVRTSLAGLNWGNTPESVKTHKSELIEDKINGCVTSLCDRCIQSPKTRKEGASCQMDWNFYNALITRSRRSDAPEELKCSKWFGGLYRNSFGGGNRGTVGWCCSLYGAHMGYVWADSSQPACNKAEGCGQVSSDIVRGSKWACDNSCPDKEHYASCPGMTNVQRSNKLDRLLDDDVQVGAEFHYGGTSWCW